MKPQAKQPEHVERAQFAKCVKTALVVRGMPASPTELQQAFNVRNPKLAVYVHAARKWLMGESLNTQARLRTGSGVAGRQLGCVFGSLNLLWGDVQLVHGCSEHLGREV